MPEIPVALAAASAVTLRKVGTYPGIRVLAWDDDMLYACRGYQLIRMKARSNNSQHIGQIAQWEPVARFDPVWWRRLTSRAVPISRLLRDGFHALVICHDAAQDADGDQTLIGAVPGAIVTRTPTSGEFKVTHQIRRGTRPLHITAVPGGRIYWGEYFDNRERAEVHIYASSDRGHTWQVAYTFPAGSIRHVHNVVYDPWDNCLWILTGDEGEECKVLRTSCDLRSAEIVWSGNQQARAVAAIPTRDALYLSTDTPSEANHILRLDRRGNLSRLSDLPSSSIYGCRAGKAIFFSTMVEPSVVNASREVHLVGSADGANWQVLARWRKDKLPMRYFQYGNARLPDGNNTTNYLAATTIAVEPDDLVTTLWEVESPPSAPALSPPSI
ncbi:MAG: hypothetical protein WA172_20945 [Terriglobales bacterium]